ncbi:MAG: 50S ribosomal protein L6 [Candidatus Methanomethylicus sp.]|nr:50S ribosomal protein L6 [Candidatus Methanomethylicus sp.]
MMSEYTNIDVEIPEGVQATVTDSTVVVTGPKGKITRDFAHTRLIISMTGNVISISAPQKGKRLKALVGTVAAHIKNMFKGVTIGHIYKMKVIYAHFPITVKVAGKTVFIENFMGERSKRLATIVGNVKVSVQGDELILEGMDKEEIGQTAANIHGAAHVKKMDPRVFQDGVYVSGRA